MSDDVKVTFSADTTQVQRAIQTIGGAGGGGGSGGGRPPPSLPPPSGPLGPVGGGGRRRGDWRDGAIDVETVGGGGGGKGRTPGGASAANEEKSKGMNWGGAVQALAFVGDFIEQTVDYAAKVKLASLRSGVDVEKIQKLTNAGMQQGISFEEITNTLIEGNRRLGQGLVSGGSVQLGLNRLGVSMEQIRNKSVSTTEVLMKMADLYKQTGDDVQMANLGVSIFGNSFTSMIPMLKQGRMAIEALGNSSMVMSKESIENAANLKRNIEQSKKMGQIAGLEIAGFFSEMLNKLAWDAMLAVSPQDNLNKKDITAAKSAYGSFSAEGESIEDFYKRKMSDFKKESKKYAEMGSVFGATEDSYAKSNFGRKEAQIINGLADIIDSQNASKKMPGFQAGQMAWATSLQAMGGGDVLSAMAQNPQQQIADNTANLVQISERIAISSERSANKNPEKSAPTLEPSVTAPK